MSRKSYYEVCSCSTGWYQPDWRNWVHPVTGVKHRSLKEAWKSYSKCRRGHDPQPNMYYDVRLLRTDGVNIEMVCTDDQSEDDAFWALKGHGDTPEDSPTA